MLLLEREREMEELDAALALASAGEGNSVAIEAAAGLGKTRLLREAREAGDRAGLAVLSGRATELERDFPFALVRQLFEAPLAAIPAGERAALLEGSSAARGALGLEPVQGAHDTFAVLHGLYWVTAALAEREPLLLAIDDAHWADSGSLDFIGFLLPRLEELPVALVITSRTDEPDPPAGLGRIEADPSIRHLKPAPLSSEATSHLLGQELGHQPEASFVTACHEVSGGNPFLLRELARSLNEEGVEPGADEDMVRERAPERVAQNILLRMSALSSEVGAVARSLAVLGEESDPGLVAELADVDLEVVRRTADELRQVSILEPDAALRFIHPLVRNAIYTSMPAGKRAGMHTEAAELLREHDADAEQIATQLLATDSQRNPETVETLLVAGEQALEAGAPQSAIAYLTRAMAESPPEDIRAAVLSPLLTAGFRAADHSVLGAVEADVFAEWEREPALRSRWAMQLTMLMVLGSRFDEAVSLLQEAVDVAVKEDDIELAFQLAAQLNSLATLVPSTPEADLDAYRDQIDPDSRAGRLAAAMEARSEAMTVGTAQGAAEAAKRALSHDGVIFAEEPELLAGVFTVMTLVAADEVEAAQRGAECALRIALERDATPELVRARFLSGFVAWARGDLIAAEADIRQAIDLARLAGILPLVFMFTGPLMEILIERDELEAAEAALEAIGLAAGPPTDNPLLSLPLLIRAHLRVEQGRFELAAEDILAISALAEKMDLGPGPLATAGPYAVRALMAIGENDRAREFVEIMMDAARRWQAPTTTSHVSRAAAALEGGERGIELLTQAAAVLEGTPRNLQRAHLLADLGAALRAEGHRAEARPPLREAMKVARRCGAVRLAKRAGAELEATGETVRRYTPIGVESLTPSERRVADLAASGMTNRQIAQTLFVTVKTVEAHLSAAYDKLDISSRQQLPAALES